MKKITLLLCLCAMLVFGMAPFVYAAISSPDAALEFTVDHITDGGGTSPFGIVELWQAERNVNVLVSLYNNSSFVRTGAGVDYNFLFNGTGVSLTDIVDWSGYSNVTAGGGTVGSIHADGTGYWQFGVYFDGQATGGGSGIFGPLGFTVLNASISDLIAGNGKYIFAADILSGVTGNTGMVSAVPIPSAALLLGFGLIGLVGMRRKLRT